MVKNLPANAGDVGLIPKWGRSSGEGNSNPLQYSCLGNLIDREAWRAIVYGVPKSQTTAEWLSSHACTRIRYRWINLVRQKIFQVWQTSSSIPNHLKRGKRMAWLFKLPDWVRRLIEHLQVFQILHQISWNVEKYIYFNNKIIASLKHKSTTGT